MGRAEVEDGVIWRNDVAGRLSTMALGCGAEWRS
jgi:hypothetical protein